MGGVSCESFAAKAESAGRDCDGGEPPLHLAHPCSCCGHVAEGNRAAKEAFKCLACGHTAHADVNAAINILRAGLALQDAQAT